MLLSEFLLNLLAYLRNLTKRESLILAFCSFILVIISTGLSTMPYDGYMALAQDPFITRMDLGEQNYFQESVLFPVLTYFLKAVHYKSFTLFSLCIVLLGYALFTFQVYKKYDPAASLIFSAILYTNPITTVLLSWLGSPDGMTFLLTASILFINSPFVLFVLALLGATNHIAFLITALEIMILRWVAKGEIQMNNIFATLLGGSLGYAGVKLFLILNNIEMGATRLNFIFSRSLFSWIWLNLKDFHTNFFSLFNMQWLIVIVGMIMFFRLDKKYYIVFLLFLSLNYTVSFFTLDTTRVFSLLSWGIFMHCLFYSYTLAVKKHELNNSLVSQLLIGLIIIVVASFISRKYYIWEGAVYSATPLLEFLIRIASL